MLTIFNANTYNTGSQGMIASLIEHPKIYCQIERNCTRKFQSGGHSNWIWWKVMVISKFMNKCKYFFCYTTSANYLGVLSERMFRRCITSVIELPPFFEVKSSLAVPCTPCLSSVRNWSVTFGSVTVNRVEWAPIDFSQARGFTGCRLVDYYFIWE